MTIRENYAMAELRRFGGMRMAYATCEYEEYDPRHSRDGGSYYQPRFTIVFADGTYATADFNVCGDFGGIITVEIVRNGAKSANVIDTREGEEDLTDVGIGEDALGYLVALHELTRRTMRFVDNRGEVCFIG